MIDLAKRRVTLLLVYTLASVVAGATGARAADDAGLFTDDLAAAKRHAAESDRFLLLDFTGSDWCFWCKRLDQEVFQVEPFPDEVVKRFVPVVLDFPRDASLVSDEVRAQNEQAKQDYKIRGYPTVILADAQGRPFATTGYKEGGPTAFLAHLEELLSLKKARDLAFRRAEIVSGVDRARLLDVALQTVDPKYHTPFYDDVIAEIVALDVDDEAGLRSRYQLIADRAAAARVRDHIEELVTSHTEALTWTELITAMDAVLEEHGKSPEIAQTALFHRATAELELGRLEAGQASLQDAKARLPDGELAPVIDRLLRVVNKQLERAREP